MKKCSIYVLFGFIGIGLMAYGWQSAPVMAETLNELTGGTIISNNNSANALSITQHNDVGKGRSNSGAFFLDNSGNRNTGMTVYSNMGGSAQQPLMRMEIDNPDWNEEVLYIHSDSPTSRGLIRLDSPAPEIELVETDQPGAKGKFELRVQHDTFQINSRLDDDSGFEKKVTMTHDGDLELHNGGLMVESGVPSEFSGGINITGGCIAVDGTCIDVAASAENAAPVTKSAVSTPSPAPAAFAGATLSAGAPSDIDCNSYTERGAMVLDHENNTFYVCNGPERGWDSLSLQD